MQARSVFVALILAVLIFPFASAIPSGLTLVEATWYDDGADGGELIAITDDGSMIASAHGKEIAFFNATTLEVLHVLEFQRNILSMEFSPDGTKLVITKERVPLYPKSLRLVELSTMELLERYSGDAEEQADVIAWNTLGDIIATQSDGGGVVLIREADMSVKTVLSDHNADISCIDFSNNGLYILTGDESGRYIVWQEDGTKYGDVRNLGEPIVDCKFSPNSQKVALMGERGLLKINTLEGEELDSTLLLGGGKIEFSSTGHQMHILNHNENRRGISSVAIDTLDTVMSTYTFHKMLDFIIIDDEYGRIQGFYIASGTGQIAIYKRSISTPGFGMGGADLDGDGVPDTQDFDDDGDGIIDSMDKTCADDSITPCHRDPDHTKIRHVEFHFGEEVLTISDSISLETVMSTHIRNMSRIGIAADNHVSNNEAALFAHSMCKNMDHDEIISNWKKSLSMSSGAISGGRVDCEIGTGMAGVTASSYSTQIKLTIITTFVMDTLIEYPLNLTLDDQPEPTEGSVAWLAPSHPISVTVSGTNANGETLKLWWNDGHQMTQLTLEKQVIEEDPVGEIIGWVFHPLMVALYMVICAVGLVLWIRRDNRIDLELDDDDEDDEDDDVDEYDSEYDEEYLEEEYEVETGEDDFVRTPPRREPPTRSIPLREEGDFFTSDQPGSQKKRRRRGVDSVVNREGPIMKTKRKRLSEVDSNQTKTVATKVVTKRKVVAMGSEQAVVEREIKTRRVRKAKVETTPVKKKKKRKATRRKAKRKKPKKDIDEKALNEDLVKGFITDDE